MGNAEPERLETSLPAEVQMSIYFSVGRCGLQPHRVLCKSNYGIYYNGKRRTGEVRNLATSGSVNVYLFFSR